MISKEIAEILRRIGDGPSNYERFSICGIYKSPVEFTLEPYRLAKFAAKVLCKFADEYLKILGFNNYIETLRPQDDFRRNIEHLRNEGLSIQ